MPRARDLMERNVLTIPAGMPFFEIQHLFVVANINAAPVVDANGRVTGMISALDLLRVADQACDEDDDDDEPGDPETSLDALTARDIASPDVAWVPADAPALEIAERMRRDSIHHVLVGDGQRLQGIVASFDLLRALR